MKKNTYEIAKDIFGLVTSVGVGAIMTCAVSHVTSGARLSLINKICIPVGGFMLGCMVSDEVQDYTNIKIDEIAEEVRNFLNSQKSVQPSTKEKDVIFVDASLL